MEFTAESMDRNGHEGDEEFVFNDGAGMETGFVKVRICFARIWSCIGYYY